MAFYADRKDPTIDKICRAVGFTGRNVTIRVNASGKMTLSGTYWDGGSRTTYYGIDLATCQTVALPTYSPPQFGGPVNTPVVDMVDGMAIAELWQHGGKFDLTINVLAANSAPLLPKSVELTDDEKIVLKCTKGYKSSYAGIKDYRFAQSGISRERWEAAKASCIAKGLLNKAGAITNDGRNVKI